MILVWSCITSLGLFYSGSLPWGTISKSPWVPAAATRVVRHSSLVSPFDHDFGLGNQKPCVLTAFRMLRGAEAYKTEELLTARKPIKSRVLTFKVTDSGLLPSP